MKGDNAERKKVARSSVAREARVCQLTRVLRVRLVGAQRGLQIRIGFARRELSFVWLTIGFESQGQDQISAANIARQDAWILTVFKEFDRAPRVGYGLLPLSTFEVDAGFAHQKSRKKGRALPDSSNGGLIEFHGLRREMGGGSKIALPKRNAGSRRRQLGKDLMFWCISLPQSLLQLIQLPGCLGERMRVNKHIRLH